MFRASTIDPRTIQAYLETEYRVHGDPRFSLQVGRFSSELLSLHKCQKADCSLFLTAFNPFSESSDESLNAERQGGLAEELTRRCLVFIPGIGQDPSGQWPGENSFLIFGLDLEAAKALGARYKQNAFIWSGVDAIPQLILLR